VSADIDVFPDTNFEAFPKSDTQTAIVVENTDPDGMARIQVQFPWQKPTGETTPFIRVVTPHGGGDKGFHFIPEIGEEVLVGFEGGNAERPYMMGSLYNGSGKAEGFKSDANDIKAMQSRSGNKMVFNDAAGSVQITDSGTASMLMDGAGNLGVNANATHTTTVGEEASIFKMDENGNITLDGKESLKISIGESTLEMLKDGTVKINGKQISINGEEIIVGGSSKTEISAPNNHIAGITKIDGGDVFIN